MSKVLLSIEQVRFLWALGFSSGRVQQSFKPNIGVTWEEETPYFESDLVRVASVNKKLSKKLQAANNASSGLVDGRTEKPAKVTKSKKAQPAVSR